MRLRQGNSGFIGCIAFAVKILSININKADLAEKSNTCLWLSNTHSRFLKRCQKEVRNKALDLETILERFVSIYQGDFSVQLTQEI